MGAFLRIERVQRYTWPNGEIWCVDHWSDGLVRREIVGNWITGEVWGRLGCRTDAVRIGGAP